MGGFFDWMFGGGDKKESEPAPAPAPAPEVKDVGNVGDVGSVEQQAASRRLARMSKYFTSPTGVLDSTTGSSGVF
jgi:hypothetical protein